MRHVLFLTGGLLLLCLVSSCSRRPACLPDFPKAADVVSVAIVPAEGLPPGKWPEKTLTQSEPIREVIRWLRDIDWSAKPGDLRVMSVPLPSRLILAKKDGSTVAFGLIDGGIIVHECNGMWKADTERLKAIWP
jgi:hypothetical protein